MICAICGKPYASLATMSLVVNAAYCYGTHMMTYTSNTTGPIYPYTPWHRLILPHLTENGPEIIDPVAPEEKPLEWPEVEQQLDEFMSTLNGREE